MGRTSFKCKTALELPNVNKIISSGKAIVTYIRQSNIACQQLKESALEQGLPTLALLQEVDTRWNSAKDLLERLYEMYPAIVSVLAENNRINLIPADNTRLNMKVLCDFLSDFDAATQIVSGEKYATISLIKPLLRTLTNHCSEDSDDSSLIKSVKEAIKKDIENRYKEPKTQKT